MADDAEEIAEYVDAAARALGMPLTGVQRAGVVAAMLRLAAFANDVAAVEISGDVEVAGVFVP